MAKLKIIQDFYPKNRFRKKNSHYAFIVTLLTIITILSFYYGVSITAP